MDPAAVIGPRQVVLSAGKPVPPASNGADRITIAPALPEVVSIEPTVVTRAAVTTLTVRGVHLQGARAVHLTPADAITLGSTIAVNAAGTELTVGLAVSDFAPLGERVVTITTGAGTSEATPSPANTLVIASETFAPITLTVAPRTARLKSTGELYDGQVYITRITDPVGLETTFHYFAGRIDAITDPTGRSTRLTHDAEGHLTAITDPDGATRRFAYAQGSHLLTSQPA